MKKFKYCYHVAYNWKKGSDTGFGTSIIKRKDPLNTPEEINSTVNFIKQENSFDALIIINFIRLKE